MRFFNAAFLAALAALPAGAAWAQVATGNEVSVNPQAAGSTTTLLYPGGQYMRVVHPLLQPGQTAKDSAPIQLHMPVKGAARAPATRTAAVSTEPQAAPAAPAPRRATAVPKTAAPRRVASVPKPAAPAPAPSAAPPTRSGGYTPSYGIAPQGAAGLDLGAAPPAQEAAKPKSEPNKQMAKAEPPPASAEPLAPGLTKRSVILFAAGASDPAQSALGAIKFLAGDLNASMVGGSSRIQLIAYGGDKGDKGSDARRLSLKRALAIRQVLIDDGVASERIDVRAMGGADDGGPADRVDVYVKA